MSESARYTSDILSITVEKGLQLTNPIVPRNTTNEAPCYVYFVQALTSGAVKIGIAVDLAKRLSSLQTGNHEEIAAIYAIKCRSVDTARELESLFHERYDGEHIRGEWYAVQKDKLIDDIEFAIRFATRAKGVAVWYDSLSALNVELGLQEAKPQTELKPKAIIDEDNPMYIEAVRIATEEYKINANLLSQRLGIKYYQASRIVNAMYDRGVFKKLNMLKSRSEGWVNPYNWTDTTKSQEAS